MKIDHFSLVLLFLFLLWLPYRKHRSRLCCLWKRTKDRAPRKWKPKTPRDYACCQADVSLVPVLIPML